MFWQVRDDAPMAWLDFQKEVRDLEHVVVTASLRGDTHVFQDVGFLVNQLQLLVDAVVVSRLFVDEADEVRAARNRLLEATSVKRLPWPWFWGPPFQGSLDELLDWLASRNLYAIPEEDPYIHDVVDLWAAMFVQVVGSWLRANEPMLYFRLGGASRLEAVTHRSPVLVTVALAVGGSFLFTGALVWAAGKVAARLREDSEIAKIREAQAVQAQADARTAQARAELAAQVVGEARRLLREGEQLPERLLSYAALLQSPAVNGLGRSPLVGEVKVGLRPW